MAKTRRPDGHFTRNVAILGGGNIGQAIAKGLVEAGGYDPARIWITRRDLQHLESLRQRGYMVTSDNVDAVRHCRTILITVQPGQLVALLKTIRQAILPNRHFVLSAVTGVTIAEISKRLGNRAPVVRVMPNTAVAIGESMTCLAANGRDTAAVRATVELFGKVGLTQVISEEHMTPATALCACGIAFFLRAIRAASQGGIQIGFHPDEALRMAAQTARGASTLLLEADVHPESEIDRVTTPRGCTIGGLNRMEHEGFSSAMIKGLVTAAEIAASLFPKK